MNTIYIDKLPDKHDKVKILKSKFIDNSLNIEFIYKSNFSNAKDLRDFIESVCLVLGISDKTKSRIILISDELNNNAIDYGTNKKGFNILRIKSKIKDGIIYFNLEVEDNGKGRNPKKALDMETLRAHRLKLGYKSHSSIRGRGLFLIIVRLVDRLYFRDSEKGGLIVGIKIKI